ncbi:cytochrome c5 family protein [Parasulfuritortus cantonensis]|uniref:Cytochrome c5 family protein n=1 Tax=Parasulfuritortus cantonensis TaxID=2528202 RepID=A0A4R1BD42_9PROT|nr:c-type cytochrome [Parasulfuritortus cantonensis]TCJ14927.1 cytochrome c5 family protein [Parasulfuritortus cantonensis]
MTDHHEMTPTTVKDFLLALLGGLAAPLLAISMIVGLVVSIQARQTDSNPADVSDQEVRERIQPIGNSVAIDPNKPHIDMTGEQVYTEVCSACHGSGALGSPKFKDTAAWGKRITQGYDTLLLHAFNGIRKMPPRGGEPDLTDLEVARAMVYMANAGGAKFEAVLQKEVEPTAAELARGKTVYAENCANCHDTGVTGAQKLTDPAWAGLIKQGKDYLYTAAIKGTFGGPAKGGNDQLSDADAKVAVDYMVNEAKAALAKAPAAAAKK